MVAMLLWWRLVPGGGPSSFSLRFSSTLFFLLFIPSPTLWLFSCFCGAAVVDGTVGGGGVVVAAMRQAGGVCCSLFSSPLCRGASLCFSVFFFLSLLCLFFYFWTMMVLSRVTGRNGGGDGGSYADRSRWFFLSSPLLCFSVGFGFFFCSFTLLTPSKFPGSFVFFTPKIHPCSYLSLCPKIPPESVVCFSPSPKFCPPCFLFLPPVFIGSRGRGSPYPVQVQGMVAWDGSCAAVAGHDLPLPSSWWQGMRVWVVSVSGQVGWKERVGKNISKIFFSPVSAFCRGEEAAQCCFERHRDFFFFKKIKMNL
jgi:hypothetical protein